MKAAQRKMERWHKKHPGFGMEKTSAEWAALSGLHKNTMRRYLFEYGMTVEEVYALRGIAPPGAGTPEPTKKTARSRKPRRGTKLEETRQEIYTILVASGYIGPDEGIETVWAEYAGSQAHRVYFKEGPLGTYKYITKELKLIGGEGVPLWAGLEDVRIVRNEYGLWELHPDTRQELTGRFFEKIKKDGMPDYRELYYENLIKQCQDKEEQRRWREEERRERNKLRGR